MKWLTTYGVHCLVVVSFALRLVSAIGPMLWSYDMINITVEASNPDVLNADAQIIRLGRGRFGFSGFIDIKQPADDRSQFQIITKRSLRKNGPYSTWPALFTVNLSTFMNKYYKPLAMRTYAECCVNAPIFEGTFVPPLSPRRIEFNECVVDNENFPNIMMEGYYWITIRMFNVTGDETVINLQTYVEAEKLRF